MSYDASDCDPVALYREERPRARKPHRCDACRETIRPGDVYIRCRSLSDGQWNEIARCLRCEAIYQHLGERGAGDLVPDWTLDCGETYEDHWDEPPPDEIAALAFVTPDEMQRRSDSRE